MKLKRKISQQKKAQKNITLANPNKVIKPSESNHTNGII
jgi:hypothetical protein